jgi:hypothetical protein
LQLLTPVNITTTATFSSGRIVTDATNLLIFNDNATATGHGDISYVNGPVRKIGNDIFTFPTGNAMYYAPIGITAPGVITDHFTAQYFHANPDLAGYDTTSMDATLEMISTREYWILDRTNGTSGVRVTMYWDSRSGSIQDMTALRVARWDGAIWRDHSFSNFQGTEAEGNLTSAANITSFSPFSFGSVAGGGALPVELTSFTAEVVPEGVALNWVTAVEINNDYFAVERSVDGVSFETIGKQAGMGNSSVEQYYGIMDLAPKAGLTYYRLKQVDTDGTFEYSDLVSVFVKETTHANVAWAMYPNPVIDKLKITGGEEGRLVGLELMDQDGRSIALHPLVFGEETQIDVSGLRPGMYIIRVITPDQVSSQRFIKL